LTINTSGDNYRVTVAWFIGVAIFFLYNKIRVAHKSKRMYLGVGCLLFIACVCYLSLATKGYTTSAIYSFYSFILTGAWFLCILVFGRGCVKAEGRLFETLLKTAKFFSSYMYSLFISHYSLWWYLHFAPFPFMNTMTAAERLVFEFIAANIVALVIGLAFERRGRRVGQILKERTGRVTQGWV